MDANDFKRKFLPYHRKLYRAAFHLMGNAQDAEDMVQEAYLKLWKRRDELPTDIANLEAYCVTLVKHVCHDTLRLAHLEEDGCPPEELPIAGSTNVAHEVELKDEARQVMTLIGQLPDQQRQELPFPQGNQVNQGIGHGRMSFGSQGRLSQRSQEAEPQRI